VYTALVYRGPGLVKEIKQGLAGLLERDGLSNISEAVGLDHERRTPRLKAVPRTTQARAA
jgi:dihydroorotate dehydrogenase